MAVIKSKQKESPHVGLTCRDCGCGHFLTVYTRRRNDGIVRRKRCRHCGQAITTREKAI
ncbi:MAG: hypothetical protein K8S55_02565 [Phycisphaerae bacterium]|nr:hypothetical protein [Phycisphaerae bacterium]